ncbi:hypothetical protein GPECTOR_35g895 [Gonium pectorale]|uniref:Uncharacterized protein n=1 Tax=Gonium pectorale TaxID=33097 RepID=A0A150GC79_GONPE|nr:hypothetical protein GPECTOR_35g895 [Gonium pectorale]|eukprot:KXZ47457.1 hypothetical protein GPECTOR_35g895 [Gonium pectorale]
MRRQQGPNDPPPAVKVPPFVRPALQQLLRSELDYFNRLPDEMRRRVVGPDIERYDRVKYDMLHYGDIAFTLAGVKPCALIAHGSGGPPFIRGLVEACVAPLMRDFRLDAVGFQLAEISHSLLTSNPVHPGFQDCWLLANTRHPAYALARETFLVPHPEPVDEREIGRALGYPLPEGGATVRYIDKSAVDEAGVGVGCMAAVPVLEYFCSDAGGVPEVLRHFAAYERVWRQLGRALAIEAQGHPELRVAAMRHARREMAR